jgi:DNA-binding Lrp family transcriptional regulator
LSFELDEVDRKIIDYLKENARATYVDIGKALSVSDATVYNRVNRLMEIGVIKKFTIEIDESVLQKRVQGFILVNIRPGSISDVSKKLVEVVGVKEVHEVHTSPDLILKVEADDLDTLRTVILKIREVSDVVQTEFMPIFKTWKE